VSLRILQPWAEPFVVPTPETIAEHDCKSLLQAVREIAVQLANDVEATVEQDTVLAAEEAVESLCPEVIANVKSVPVSGRILLVDGFTVTAADTPENRTKRLTWWRATRMLLLSFVHSSPPNRPKMIRCCQQILWVSPNSTDDFLRTVKR
jgi:hypothetical protein